MNLGIPTVGTEVECRDYHTQSLNYTQICNFMKTTANCAMDEGFINYLTFTYCSFSGDTFFVAIILLALWLIVLFIGLGTVADTFFCPSLRTIADTMKLSQNIAGVTFLAFGNGAPDVFSAIAAVGSSKDGDSGLAFGALFGAAVFITTVIVGTISFIQPFTSVQRPLLRDMIFFIFAAFWAFVVIWDGEIVLWETLGFLFLYGVYIFVVIFGRYVNQKIKLSKGIVTKNDFKAKTSNAGKSNIQDSYNGEDDRDSDNDDEANEPLLGDIREDNDVEASDISTKNNYPMSLKTTCLPIDLNEWNDSNLFNKIYICISAPVYYVLKVTIPLVDYDIENSNWNKVNIMLNCLIAPSFMTFATQIALTKLGNAIPIWSISLVLGVVLCFIVFWFTEIDKPPKIHWLFAYFGFAVSIVWIYTIANEIVNLLTTFGVVLNISNTILGLTFLAWGNSVSDLVANAASARRGYPNMGISACFGGPIFNILLGIGVPFTFKCIKSGKILIQTSFLQDILALFTGISLISTIIFIPCNKFYFGRRYAVCLLIFYAVFLTVCILIESKVLKNPFA